MTEKKRRVRKNSADNWMPERVYRGKCAYEWHPTGGAINLCKLDADEADVWNAYKAAVKKYNKPLLYSVTDLANDYFKSIEFRSLATTTRKDYRGAWVKLEQVFGQVSPNKITSPMVRRYMDTRGINSTHRANRERVLLHNFYAWGFQREYVTIEDPTVIIKPFKNNVRERYVEDGEYAAVYQCATPVVQACMELALICAARQRDILDIQRSHLRDEGLFIRQGKTGKKQVKKWTSRLHETIESLQAMPSEIATTNIVHTRKGMLYTSSGFKAMWRRAMDKAMGICRKKKSETTAEYEIRKAAFLEKYPPRLTESFTFHDIKAKSISDYEEGNKQEFSGHKSARMVREIYDRKPALVESHNPKSDPKK